MSCKLAMFIVIAMITPSICAPRKEALVYEPCKATLKIRHSRSTQVQAVKNQLRSFVSHLRLSIRRMHKVYGVDNRKGHKLQWLKAKQWLNEIIRAPDQKTKLQRFHRYLQHFAGTLFALTKVKVKTHANNFNKRERDMIYEDISKDLNLLMYEVQSTLKDSYNIVTSCNTIDIPKELRKLDFTAVQLIDVNFLKKTMKFTKKISAHFRVKKVKSGKKSKRT